MAYTVINILDMLDANKEAELRADFASFSCGKNDEIDTFLRKNAIQFARKKLSITYLVYDTEDAQLLAYFTLTHKSIEIDFGNVKLSKTKQEKFKNYVQYDEETGALSASAFLLAQFGKAATVDNGNRISGEELMFCVNDILQDIRRRIGGGIVYLDCEDRKPLVDFYTDTCKFVKFGERISSVDGIRYLQFMKTL